MVARSFAHHRTLALTDSPHPEIPLAALTSVILRLGLVCQAVFFALAVVKLGHVDFHILSQGLGRSSYLSGGFPFTKMRTTIMPSTSRTKARGGYCGLD